MKKIISIVLSAVMLMSIAVTGISATVPSDPYDLESYGQKHYYIVPADTAPTADGVINEGEYGEYGLAEKDMKTADDMKDDRFFLYGTSNIEYLNIYMNYDAENIYLAAQVRDKTFTAWSDCINFELQIGDDRITIYFPDDTSTDVAPEFWMDGENLGLHESIVSHYKTTEAGQPTTYEIIIKRSCFDETDKILFGASVRDAGADIMFYGFENTQLQSAGVKGLASGFYGNVVHFIDSVSNVPAGEVAGTPKAEEPETPATPVDPDELEELGALYDLGSYGQEQLDVARSATAPKADGVISSGEYAYSKTNMTAANDVSDGSYYINTATADIEYVNFYMSHDANNIYLAAQIKDSTPAAWSDSIEFYLGVGNSDIYQIYMPFDYDNAPPEIFKNDEAIETAGVINSRYVGVNGQVATYEIVIDRAAIGAYYDSVLIGACADNSYNENICFGFKNTSVTEAPIRDDIGLYGHVANLIDTLVTPPATDDDTDNDNNGGYYLTEYGQKHYYTGKAVDTAPVMDGKVSDGEYTLAINDMNTANAADDRFFMIGNCSKVEGFNIYAAQDENYIYLAIESKDTSASGSDGVGIYLCPTNNTGDLSSFRIPFSYSGGDPYVVGSNTIEDCASAHENGIITYEIMIDRIALADHVGLENINQVYMLVAVNIGEVINGDEWNEMWFGFEVSSNSPILAEHSGLGPAKDRLPHVLFLYDEDDGPADYKEYNREEAVKELTSSLVSGDPESEPTVDDTNAPDTQIVDRTDGCGSSIAAIGAALVATFGVCTAFVAKKKD